MSWRSCLVAMLGFRVKSMKVTIAFQRNVLGHILARRCGNTHSTKSEEDDHPKLEQAGCSLFAQFEQSECRASRLDAAPHRLLVLAVLVSAKKVGSMESQEAILPDHTEDDAFPHELQMCMSFNAPNPGGNPAELTFGGAYCGRFAGSRK